LNRRINLYRNYVDRFFDSLSLDYQFLGGVWNQERQMDAEEYTVGKEYDAVLLMKRKD